MQFLTVFLQNSYKRSIFTRTTQVWFKPVRFHWFFLVFFFMEWLNCNWKSGFFQSSLASVRFFSSSMDWTFNPYHQFMNPLHRVEVSFMTRFTSHLMWINHLSRDGMACFLTKIPSRTLDFIISLVTLTAAARFPYLDPKISLSLIPLNHLSSLSTTATARTYHWQLVHSCYVKNGFQQHSLVLEQFSLSTVLKTFMNSPYKARQISMTTTIFYDLIVFLTDKYMRISTWCPCPSHYSLIN